MRWAAFGRSLLVMTGRGVGQPRQFGRAIPVQHDKFGDIPAGHPQVAACRLQLSTQQGALVLQHLYAGGHPQFKPAVVDKIVFHYTAHPMLYVRTV